MKILYFASLRDRLGCATEELNAGPEIGTVAELINLLQQRGEPWSSVLSASRVMVAVNQEMARPATTLSNHDEVALFPPVTGG
jgi:molybdopterin synthase sulfur carrier subunit